MSVGNGAMLSGNGSVAGATTIANGGHLSPAGGGILGTLNLAGGLTLNSGSVLDYDFSNGGSPAADLTSIASGALTLPNNGLIINLDDLGGMNSSLPVTYNLFNVGSGLISGFTPGYSGIGTFTVGAGSLSSESYSFALSGNILQMTLQNAITTVNGAWSNTGGGSWPVTANWNGGVPKSQGDSATFGSAITAPANVTLDGDKTISALSFSNTNAYTISQGSSGVLTLTTTTSPVNVSVAGAAHVISTPVAFGARTSTSTLNPAARWSSPTPSPRPRPSR